MTAPDSICPLGEDCDLHIAWMAGAEDQRDRMKARIDALQAENLRLRDALAQIAGQDGRFNYPFPESHEDYPAFAIMTARAALGGDKP